jgi:cellulose synthase/poly-beta-1,6-N-acetylglucosamine synthase-like glycosyltransferase
MVIWVIFAALFYVFFISVFFIGWIKLPLFNKIENASDTKVSVIIPFRNEEAHLSNILQCLKNQTYPINLTEIIFVNDHSTDNSIQIIENEHLPNISILHLQDNILGKKAALLEGTKKSTGNLIITTDADCTPGSEWISTYVSYYSKYNSKMIVGPVMLLSGGNIISKFQHLEFLSLQGSAAGAIKMNCPIMCNGANLAFSRDCLSIVQETYRNSGSSSGDDIFALLAVKKQFPGQVHFLKSKNAIVTTQPCYTISDFLNQRKRWTSKARYYTDFTIIATALIVLFTNLILLGLFLSGIIYGNWNLFFALLLIKSIIDLPFLHSISVFFDSRNSLKWFPLTQCFYFLYVSITFVSSLLGNFTWKSRKLRA